MASQIERSKVNLPTDEPRLYEHRGTRLAKLFTAPWWLFLLGALWIWAIYNILIDDTFRQIFNYLADGIPTTLYIAVVSYLFALIIGLFTGMVRAYSPTAPNRGSHWTAHLRAAIHTAAYNLVTFYIEFIRGIPALVFLLIAGFILVPALTDTINETVVPLIGQLINDPEIPDLVWRGRDPATAIAGLSIIYGAFLSEIFRAGILSVPRGQIEAAKSLGMTQVQIMRFIIVPQAVRNMLPPLGNDFIAMIKDTSLVTILGTPEITQLARKWSGSSFKYLETYMILSLIYLTMTISGSLIVQRLEKWLNRSER